MPTFTGLRSAFTKESNYKNGYTVIAAPSYDGDMPTGVKVGDKIALDPARVATPELLAAAINGYYTQGPVYINQIRYTLEIKDNQTNLTSDEFKEAFQIARNKMINDGYSEARFFESVYLNLYDDKKQAFLDSEFVQTYMKENGIKSPNAQQQIQVGQERIQANQKQIQEVQENIQNEQEQIQEVNVLINDTQLHIQQELQVQVPQIPNVEVVNTKEAALLQRGPESNPSKTLLDATKEVVEAANKLPTEKPKINNQEHLIDMVDRQMQAVQDQVDTLSNKQKQDPVLVGAIENMTTKSQEAKTAIQAGSKDITGIIHKFIESVQNLVNIVRQYTKLDDHKTKSDATKSLLTPGKDTSTEVSSPQGGKLAPSQVEGLKHSSLGKLR